MNFGNIKNITFKHIEYKYKELKEVSIPLKGINSSNKEDSINRLRSIPKIDTVHSIEIETDNFLVKIKPNLGKYLMVDINYSELSNFENVLNTFSSSVSLVLGSIKFYDIPEYKPVNYIEYVTDDTYKYQAYTDLYLCICFENFENKLYYLIYINPGFDNGCHLSIYKK